MANEVNIYTPRYLAEVVRQAPPVHTFFRDTFFTNIKTFATEPGGHRPGEGRPGGWRPSSTPGWAARC